MRLVRPLVVASLGVAVIGLLAACAGGGLDARLSGPGPVQEGGSIPVGGPGEGERLPDSTFQRLDGGDTTFAAYRGKPLVVNVWASWCDPCLREMPEFEQVHQALGDKVTFIGLNSNDLHDQAEAMAAKTGVTYDLLFDPKASFVADTGVVAMPSTLFVDADGKVVAAKSGALSADDLQGELHELFGT